MKKAEIMRLLPIETERLVLRLATTDDVDLVQSAKESRAAAVLRRWMSWSSDEGMSVNGTIEYLTMANDAANTQCVAIIGVDKETGAHVLSTGLDAEDDDFSVISTGWWLSGDNEGKGLAHEGMTALIDACRTKTDMQKMTASRYEGNIRSGQLMERLGFVHTDTTHKTHRCHLNGELMDEYEYELEFRK